MQRPAKLLQARFDKPPRAGCRFPGYEWLLNQFVDRNLGLTGEWVPGAHHHDQLIGAEVIDKKAGANRLRDEHAEIATPFHHGQLNVW
jgi:hypothetical protein